MKEFVKEKHKHSELTDKIIKAYYNVYNNLGYGFLEKVYENSLLLELSSLGLKCSSQHPIQVNYNGKEVGKYFADIVIEDSVIVELKAVESIIEQHEAQLLNYLKATNYEVGLLLNFGPSPQIKRKVFGNEYKKRNRTQIIKE